MKEKYVSPTIEIASFSTCDIITVSGGTLAAADVVAGSSDWNSEWDSALR